MPRILFAYGENAMSALLYEDLLKIEEAEIIRLKIRKSGKEPDYRMFIELNTEGADIVILSKMPELSIDESYALIRNKSQEVPVLLLESTIDLHSLNPSPALTIMYTYSGSKKIIPAVQKLIKAVLV